MINSPKPNINASLVVPVFNNESTLIEQLKKCESVMKIACSKYEILVCDDKSRDTSAVLLKKNFSNNANFKLIFHTKNNGIAKTIKELYRKAIYDYVVLFSADGGWDPNDIEKLISRASINNCDIVVGKRNKSQYSIYRKTISFFYNALPIILFGVNTIDAGSIKVIKKQIIDSTKIISRSVFFEAEIIIRAQKNGKKVESIPIDFKKHKGKKSLGGKINLVVLSFIDALKLRFSL